MTTLKLDIAGLTINYRNAPDLSEKVQTTLQGLKGQRTAIENQAKELRIKERELERFLGVPEAAKLGIATKEDKSYA